MAMTNGEVVNVIDADGQVVGRVSREQAERDNHTTENVLVFVFNSLGRVWLQKRPRDKKHYPGLWDISACGGIISGETPLEAAGREQLEEMGFTCDLQHVKTFLNTFPAEDDTVRQRLSHVFIGLSDEEPRPNPDADEFLAVGHDALVELVQENQDAYVPSFLAEYAIAYDAYSELGQSKPS